MNMQNKCTLLSRVNQLNLRYMYIYLMCFNVLIFFSNIYIWNFILYKINIKKTKKNKNEAQNRVQYFDDEMHDYRGDNHYLVDIGMKNVKKEYCSYIVCIIEYINHL